MQTRRAVRGMKCLKIDSGKVEFFVCDDGHERRFFRVDSIAFLPVTYERNETKEMKVAVWQRVYLSIFVNSSI